MNEVFLLGLSTDSSLSRRDACGITRTSKKRPLDIGTPNNRGARKGFVLY
jgi:hypothetical protein